MIRKSKNYYMKLITASLFLFAAGNVFCQTINEAMDEKNDFNYEKSLKIAEKLENDKYSQSFLPWAYLRAGKTDKAVESFLLDETRDFNTRFGLALSYFLKKDYYEAEDALEDCLSVNKNAAVCEYLLGEIEFSRNNFGKAIKHYKKALKLDYNLSEVNAKLAKAYTAQKDYDNSFREWKRISNIDPKNKVAESEKTKLVSLISAKPSVIAPSVKIKQPTETSPAKDAEKIPKIRVGIEKSIKEINLWAPGGLEIYLNDKKEFETEKEEIFTLVYNQSGFKEGDKIAIKPKLPEYGTIFTEKHIAKGFAWSEISDRQYRGYFEVSRDSKGFTLVNIVNIEEYLYAVLPSEMIAWWPEEALKAQAVIARTQVYYRKNAIKLHKKDGYDICDNQHCQVYSGIKQENKKTNKAVDETRGEVLIYKGSYVNTLFSSNCSGHTQSSGDLYGWYQEPYLKGTIDGNIDFSTGPVFYEHWIKNVPDIFCAPSKYTYYAESRWIRFISQDELKEWLNRKYKLGGIKKIIPLVRSEGGFINSLKIVGTQGSVIIKKEHHIRALVFGMLRSTNFIVEGYGGNLGKPDYFVFWGGGWGHAVGFCQSGAAGMAINDHKYKTILEKYYKDINIKKLKY